MPSRVKYRTHEGDGNAQDEDQVERQEALQGDGHRQGAGRPGRQAPRHDQAHRNARGTAALSAPDAKIVKGFMPYDR